MDFALRCLRYPSFRRFRAGSDRRCSIDGLSVSEGNENCGDFGSGVCAWDVFAVDETVSEIEGLSRDVTLEARLLRQSLVGPEYKESAMNFSSENKLRA